MKVFAIKSSDITRCPKGSFSARHFFPDGNCKCSQVPAWQAELKRLQFLRQRFLDEIDARILDLKEGIRS